MSFWCNRRWYRDDPQQLQETADLLTRNYVNRSIQLWYHILSPKLTSTLAENKKNFWQDRNANLGEGTGSTWVRYLSTLIFYYQWLKCTNMFFRFLLVGIWGSPCLYLIQLWSLGAVAPFFHRQTMTRSLWTPGKRRWRSRRVVIRSEFGAVPELLSERTPEPFADKKPRFPVDCTFSFYKKQFYTVTNGPS